MAEKYKIESLEWDLKKRNIKGLLRKAKEVHLFIHSDYFGRSNDADTPRHKVTISYALDFIDAIPEDRLPGIAKLKADNIIYLLVPREWIEDFQYD